MSRRYFDDPHGPSRRRVIIDFNQPSDSSSRRNVPPPSRDFAYQSTFQPNRDRNPPPPSPRYHHEEYPHSDGHPNSTRSSFNQMNNASNDRPHRRYQLEAPSTRSHQRQPHSYHDNHQNVSHPSDRHTYTSRQPSTNLPSGSQLYRYDQDYPRHERNSDQYDQWRYQEREETVPSRFDRLHSNHRSVDVPSPRQYSNAVRSFEQPFLHSSMPVQRHNPASLLANILQSFFGGHDPSFNDDDHHDHSSSDPIDLIAFAFAMQRPNGVVIPGAVHIQFGDLFDLLAQQETPSVGLSDSDIERIPTMTYRKRSKSKSTDDKCAVCLSEYKTGETVKRLRCKHFFHPECIDPWLKTSTQCPICRGAQTD